MPLAIGLILLLTWICVLGTDISARLQNVLILGQVFALLVFAVVAIAKAVGDDSALDAIDPSLELAEPVRGRRSGADVGPPARRLRLLGLGVGGEPERGDHRRQQHPGPGRAAGRRSSCSVTYVSVAVAVVAFAGTAVVSTRRRRGGGVRLRRAGRPRCMGDWGWVRAGRGGDVGDRLDPDHDHPGVTHRPLDGPPLRAARRTFGKIDPRHRTPDVSTWWVAGIAIVWYVGIYQVSANALFDSLTALSLLIAFYYALTGVACAVYYRKHLLESAKNLILIGIGPLVGLGPADLAPGPVGPRHVRPGRTPTAASPGSASVRRWSSASASSLAGVVLMFIWRTQDKRYWQERAGLPDPDVVHGVKAPATDPDGLEG